MLAVVAVAFFEVRSDLSRAVSAEAVATKEKDNAVAAQGRARDAEKQAARRSRQGSHLRRSSAYGGTDRPHKGTRSPRRREASSSRSRQGEACEGGGGIRGLYRPHRPRVGKDRRERVRHGRAIAYRISRPAAELGDGVGSEVFFRPRASAASPPTPRSNRWRSPATASDSPREVGTARPAFGTCKPASRS